MVFPKQISDGTNKMPAERTSQQDAIKINSLLHPLRNSSVRFYPLLNNNSKEKTYSQRIPFGFIAAIE